MNDHWDCLGIEPTDDLATIKRAYAKALKLNRPEDDADAYQRLREAYDWAQQFARWAKANPGWREEDEDPDEDVSETDEAAAPSDLDSPTSSHEVRPPPEHEVRISVSPPDHRAWWQCVGVDPAAVLMPHDRVLLMGEGAAEPLIFVSVLGQAAPTLVPRWHRHVVPEHEATWADPIYGFDDLHAVDANDVLDVLADWRDADDPNEDRSEALVHLLHQLPLREQDEVQVRCAEFVLEQPELPHRLLSTLADYFGWGRDFRVEHLIGEYQAFALYERLEAAAHALASLDVQTEAVNYLLISAQVQAQERHFAFWLRILLSPFAHLRQLLQPELRETVSAAGADVGGIVDAVRFVLILGCAGIAGVLWALHGDRGVFARFIPALYPVFVLGGGALIYQLWARQLLPGLAQLVGGRASVQTCSRLEVIRKGSLAHCWGMAYLGMLAVTVGYLQNLASEGLVSKVYPPTEWVVLSIALSFAPLWVLWPRHERWESLMVPLWLVLWVSLKMVPAIGGVLAAPIAATWVLLAQFVTVVFPQLASKVVFRFFGLIRPSGAGWIAFAVFFKGVMVFYAALALFSPPLWAMVYARKEGEAKAWLVFIVALGWLGTGRLPFNGFSVLICLFATFFAVTRMERVAGQLITRPVLGAAGGDARA